MFFFTPQGPLDRAGVHLNAQPLGKNVSLEQVEETSRLAARHGFKLAGFRSFERQVTEEYIEGVRKAAGRV